MDQAAAFGAGPGSTLLSVRLVSVAASSLAVGCGITDLQHRVAESGAIIFLMSVEKCPGADTRDILSFLIKLDQLLSSLDDLFEIGHTSLYN